MKVYKIALTYKSYQTVKIPNGAAPLNISEDGTNGIALFFIGPDSLLGVENGEFGVHVMSTTEEFPADLRLFPVPHPLINRVDPANAKYLGSVNHFHVFLGTARPTLTSE